jgi:hypothetical protein
MWLDDGRQQSCNDRRCGLSGGLFNDKVRPPRCRLQVPLPHSSEVQGRVTYPAKVVVIVRTAGHTHQFGRHIASPLSLETPSGGNVQR